MDYKNTYFENSSVSLANLIPIKNMKKPTDLMLIYKKTYKIQFAMIAAICYAVVQDANQPGKKLLRNRRAEDSRSGISEPPGVGCSTT